MSPRLFNFKQGAGLDESCKIPHSKIMQNARLDESEAGIKTAQRNINNLRYADDTTLMAESEEEIKNLLMKMKEKSGKACLKPSI